MKSILILTFLILISCDTSGQKRYLVSPTSEVYEITSDQSALSLVRKLNGADRAAASGVCTDRATFGYPLTAFPVTQVYKTFPKDIIGQWFVAKATGTIDTVFWYMPGEINTYDSTLYSRIQQSNIGPDYGPGVRPGPYDPPCQSWGYWINTNDPDQGVAAFIEEATDTTWVSTINGPVPSVPPFNPEIWGWGGVALKARPGINYYDLGFLGAPFVTVGDKLFISFRVNFNPSYHQHLHWWELGSTEFALSGFRVTPSDEDYPSRSWKFNEHDYNIYDGAYPFCAGVPAESLKRGWIARGGMGPDSTDVLVYNMWYSMTVTSNTPPTIEYQERLPSTFSTAARPLQALITDCSPSWQWWAGVRSASIRYTVNGVEQPDILMNDLGGDVWEGIIPGQPPPAIMTYRIVATDLEGATSSGPPNSYSVIPFGNVWYDIDTGAACVTYDILSTGTTVPNSSFFLPSTANPGGSPTDDGTAGPFDMGSTYTIFGDTFRYAWIGVDGAIGLGKTPTDTVGITDFGGHQPNIFPPFDTARILDLPGAYISPFWADRVVEDSSGMYGRVVYGNEGDTCLFIVEWDSLAVAGPDTSYQDDARFRVILNRCTGSVEFQYDDMGNYGLDSANITGMQADSGALTGPDPASVTLNILGYPAGTRPHDNWCVKLYPTVGALVQNGWNMVALSALPIDENYSASVLFPGATSKFYCFPYTGTCPDALTQGRGYWMKFPEAGRYGRSAGTFFREVSVPVADKWNMIGGTSGFVDVGAIVPGGTSITTPFWGYGPEGYYIATTIQPGTGYWVKVAGAGTLRMTSLMSAPKPASRSAGELEFGSSGMIAFTDAAGRSQRLYIGDATRVTGDSGYFELPPEPPPGIFDVRFTSQKILEVYPRNPDPVFRREYPLQMRGAVYPVTLRWNMSGIAGDNLRVTVSDGIGESPLRQALEGSGSVRIRDPKTQTLLVTLAGSGGPPVSFSLDQNFPNPFNSTTVITFSTPERGQVRLSVYDILGREVRILVDEEREAGVQSVSFDAVGL
ncbi:MAG TPA: hypothetical protein VJO14_04795, partial [Bacteroidota bacterium]|nr:hypothetical protein [Bacteroidota bacterium]